MKEKEKDSNRTRIEIYDTTLRDGTQAQGVSLSLEDKLLLTEALDALGVDYIEGGYPLSNPKDEAFFRAVRKRKLANARIAAFGMTRRKGTAAGRDAGMKALLASEARVVTIVGKSWNLHVRQVLCVSEQENLDMIAESVAMMKKHGRTVFFDAEHFFDGFAADEAFAMATLSAARDAGADAIVLCDTNGGAAIEGVSQCVRRVAERFPGLTLGVHCHNDCGLAVANSLAAVRCGCTHVQGTINGIGERCGNADLTSVIPNLAMKYGYRVLRENTLGRLTEASRYVYEVVNLNFQDNQPFVGASAFAHKGGMHVHAMQRNTDTYEHIKPQLVGNSRRILVSELSGVSNIAATAPQKFNIGADKEVQRRILKALMDMENQGYQFEASEASFEVLIRKTLGGQWYRKMWDLDHYRCVITKHNGQAAGTEAIVKLRVNAATEHTVAEGDGPVDSLHKALCAALRPHWPGLDKLHLADYKVRVVNMAAETAAKVRVVIDWHDSAAGTYFGSVGVSENIIDASWLAITDAIEYKLLNEK